MCRMKSASISCSVSSWIICGTSPGGCYHDSHTSLAAGVVIRRELFPLDRARRLGGDVVDDAVDAVDLVDDAVADPGQHIVRQPRPVGRHRVLAGDGADGADPAVG